jgi:hypothetical protein
MLENMTTEEKVIAGITAVGIAALVFHKPTRNAVGLSDGKRKNKYPDENGKRKSFYIIEANRFGTWDMEILMHGLAEAKEQLKKYKQRFPKVKFRINKEK